MRHDLKLRFRLWPTYITAIAMCIAVVVESNTILITNLINVLEIT